MMNKRVTAVSIWTLVMLLFAAPMVPIASQVDAQSTDDVSRLLPESAECGQIVDVTLFVSPPSGTDAWVVDEALPVEVMIESVDTSNAGEYNEDQHKVKWVSFTGASAEIGYTITVPEDTADGTVLVFDGEYRFNPLMDERDTISGDSELPVTCGGDETQEPDGNEPDDETPSEDESDEALAEGSIMRVLPQEVTCGTSFTVTLDVAPPEGTTSWIVEESPPEGTSIMDVDDRFNGEYVEEHHAVKWLSFNGTDTQVTYDVLVPPGTTDGQTLTFSGDHRFHPVMENRSATLGDDEVTVSCEAVTRSLPSEAAAGSTVQVTLQVIPLPGTSDWIIDEALPEQVTLADQQSGDQGDYNEEHHRVKWLHLGPHEVQDAEPVQLSYNVTLDDDLETGTLLAFNGTYRFHPVQDENQPVTGDQTLCVAPCPGPDPDDGSNGSDDDNGGGGGGGDDNDDDNDDDDDPRDPVQHNVDATAIPSVPGSLATYEAAFPAALAGDTIRISFEDPDVPEMKLELGSDLTGVVLTFTKWPGDTPPPGSGDTIGGTQTAFFIQVTGLGSGHRATFTTEIDAEDRPEDLPQDHSVVFLAQDLEWTLVALMDLQDEGDRLRGEFTVDCCSVFAVAFDTQPPEVSLSVTVDPETETALVRAEVDENVQVDQVEFFINQDHWTTLTEPPYEFTLDIEGYTPGEQVVAVRAMDTTGWSDEATESFNVQQAEEVKEPTSAVFWVLGSLAAAAAVAIGGVFLMRSGQGEKIRTRMEELFNRGKK